MWWPACTLLLLQNGPEKPRTFKLIALRQLVHCTCRPNLAMNMVKKKCHGSGAGNPLFSWSELKYLRSIAKTELTYPPFWLNLLLGVNIRANIFRMEKQNITISDECWLPRSILLTSQRVYLRHNRDLARAKINGKFHLSIFGLTFKQNSRKIKQSVCILMIWTFTVKYAHIRDFAKQKS